MLFARTKSTKSTPARDCRTIFPKIHYVEAVLFVFKRNASCHLVLIFVSSSEAIRGSIFLLQHKGVTGLGVLGLLADKEKLIADTAKEIKAQNTQDLAKRAGAVVAELRDAKSEIESLNGKLASSKLDAILASAVDVKGVKLVTARLDGMNVNAARALTDTIKSNADTVAVLAVVADGKLNFLACAGADAVKAGAHAGKLVGAVAAIASGKGGGRPDSAMAGASDVSAVEKALASAAELLGAQIK